MKMDFTKTEIDHVELTCKSGKYYLAAEVDELLNALSDSAGRKNAELERLRAVEAEYIAKKLDIADALLSAKAAAQEQIRLEKEKYSTELAALIIKRNALESEIDALEKRKSDSLDSYRSTLAALMDEISGNMPGD